MVVSRQGLDPFTYEVEGMVSKCVGLNLTVIFYFPVLSDLESIRL